MSPMETKLETTKSLQFATLSMLILLTLLTPPALANQTESLISSQRFGKLAQLGIDERRALRERWEMASPEERIRLRQFFQDRLNQLPAPAQAGIGIPFPDLVQDNTRPNNDKSQEGGFGFGFGFEKRRFEEPSPIAPLWPGNR
jgi:hypothetical protein